MIEIGGGAVVVFVLSQIVLIESYIIWRLYEKTKWWSETYKKTKEAMNQFSSKTGLKNCDFVVAGGVASNKSIRENLQKLAREKKFNSIFPDLEFCGDNAAMIAWAGIKRFKKKLVDDINFSAKSRWPLDSEAPFMKGPGLKL